MCFALDAETNCYISNSLVYYLYKNAMFISGNPVSSGIVLYNFQLTSNEGSYVTEQTSINGSYFPVFLGPGLVSINSLPFDNYLAIQYQTHTFGPDVTSN